MSGGKKAGHFDRSEKGGRAANSNGFDGVGNSAVGGKTFGTGVDNFNDSSESSKSFQLVELTHQHEPGCGGKFP